MLSRQALRPECPGCSIRRQVSNDTCSLGVGSRFLCGPQQRPPGFLGLDVRQRLGPIAFLAIGVQSVRASRVLVKLDNGLFLLALDADLGVHGNCRVRGDVGEWVAEQWLRRLRCSLLQGRWLRSLVGCHVVCRVLPRADSKRGGPSVDAGRWLGRLREGEGFHPVRVLQDLELKGFRRRGVGAASRGYAGVPPEKRADQTDRI